MEEGRFKKCFDENFLRDRSCPCVLLFCVRREGQHPQRITASITFGVLGNYVTHAHTVAMCSHVPSHKQIQNHHRLSEERRKLILVLSNHKFHFILPISPRTAPSRRMFMCTSCIFHVSNTHDIKSTTFDRTTKISSIVAVIT